ncbi:hypothetical protein KM043_001841 [Ampulex compressa]|nr:hypothetical protein KM043_001841 [Ampulex compressa]
MYSARRLLKLAVYEDGAAYRRFPEDFPEENHDVRSALNMGAYRRHNPRRQKERAFGLPGDAASVQKKGKREAIEREEGEEGGGGSVRRGSGSSRGKIGEAVSRGFSSKVGVLIKPGST